MVMQKDAGREASLRSTWYDNARQMLRVLAWLCRYVLAARRGTGVTTGALAEKCERYEIILEREKRGKFSQNFYTSDHTV